MSRWKEWLIVVITAGLCGYTWYEHGIGGMTTNPISSQFGVPGCFCHGNVLFEPVDSVHVWISGPDTVERGSSSVFRVSVSKLGNIGAGFNTSVYYGRLDTVEGQATRLDEEYPLDVTHGFPKLAAGHDTVSWEFRYIAPDTADAFDTIYAVGNSVDLSGAPDSGDAWNFADNKLIWIKDNVVSVPDRTGPMVATLHQNYPNPFNPTTTISYELRKGGPVELRIYNSLGRVVRVLDRSERPAGQHRIVWDGTNEAGQRVASGLYFFRLNSGSFSAVRRMALIK